MATPDSAPASRRPARLPAFERRVLGGSLLVASPVAAALVGVLFAGAPEGIALWLLLVAIVVCTWWLARWQYRRLIYPIHTLSSLLEALREGDYSMRGAQHSVLGDVVFDINALAERLQNERVQFEESSYLLGKTLAALDNAVLVFDQDDRLRLLNPAAQRLLHAARLDLFGRTAQELGVRPLLDLPSGQLLSHVFPGRSGRFEIRHAPLRRGGKGGRLLVINDVGRVLREEERQAWQRLLRVLGHEVNNSLAPIQSMAETLATLVAREPMPADWREDFHSGLDVIGKRAGALGRFLSGYSRLARLPPPHKREVNVARLVEKVVRLEQRLPVQLEAGATLVVQADADQLEQALINLLGNAVEASLASRGGVVVRWRSEGERVVVEILDEGPGLPKSDNLFVPFFTTKPNGSGIGLALARQIAEAHEGGVSLSARTNAPGSVAQLWLPLEPSEPP
jgi:nitrogen fixation/metabolism regulation signal transduction histidine kinase